ncbi:MAG: RluA family pseudouridine synthase [Verrucomicrobia bacterium]|nr:RluA family pseudouridine synthase [Verrucomicrobiota bacterium]
MEESQPEILYSDNHILIASKPAGWLTQPDGSKNPSLEAFAKEWVKAEYNKPGAVFLHAIHRLDKPVSGLVLFARTSKALSRLNEQSREQEIERIYWAEVEGVLSMREGRLKHHLIHGEHKALVGREGDREAKLAVLNFLVEKYKSHSSLISIDLETGRYHQIRAQFSAIGHPIVGDKRYGSRTGNPEAIHLHGWQLLFQHPVTNEEMSFESPPPFE